MQVWTEDERNLEWMIDESSAEHHSVYMKLLLLSYNLNTIGTRREY